MAAESAAAALPRSEWAAGVADFDHFKRHAEALCAGARSWDQLANGLRQCATCTGLCDLVDKRLRARFLKKRWKGREPELLEALTASDEVSFCLGDRMTCTWHTQRRPNSDYHSQLLVECVELCSSHESVCGAFVGCACSRRRFCVCSELMPRLSQYRRVMCPRQLLALEYREYKALSLALAGEGSGADDH